MKREIITSSPIQNRCTFVSTPFLDYEELKIAIGNATATGRNSISLDNESYARIYGVEENMHVTIDDCLMRVKMHAYKLKRINQPMLHLIIMYFPPTMETNKEFPAENNDHRKRTRTHHENSSSIDIMTRARVQEKISLDIGFVTGIATVIQKMGKLMEKREREKEKGNGGQEQYMGCH